MLNQAQNNAVFQGGQATATQVETAAPIRPLETVSQCADRVQLSAQRVQNFLDRFHGADPTEADNGREIMTVSYSRDFARLYGNLEMLESALSTLEALG